MLVYGGIPEDGSPHSPAEERRSWGDCLSSQRRIFCWGNTSPRLKTLGKQSQREGDQDPDRTQVSLQCVSMFLVRARAAVLKPWPLSFMLKVKSNNRYLRLYWNIHQPLLSELLFILRHGGRWDKWGFSHLQLYAELLLSLASFRSLVMK